ncbi:heat shock protein HslJ [Erwinia sp. CPCC 100877]|nr:heat shock protein HslJ [Erwinia sp. CPCC 100877]
MKKSLTTLLVACSTLVGCVQGDNSAADARAEQLQHHRFLLKSVDGKPLTLSNKSGHQPEIDFGEKMHISGTMCNRFTGQGELSNGVLKAQLASTRMMCVDPQLNALDKLFGQMLAAGAHVSMTNDRLTLRNEQHTLVFKRADWVN